MDQNTFGKIPEIVQAPIDPLTVMFLINAAYFKGVWTILFDVKDTRQGTFHLTDGTDISVPMMHRAGGYRYFRGDAFEAVKLAYGEGRVNMALFLPDPDTNLEELVARLDGESWQGWMSEFRPAPSADESTIAMPRFKIEYEATLNQALDVLGMGIAFDPGLADFDGINPDVPDLYISRVKHKTFVEVNEVGTEAAAVTSVSVGVTSVQPGPISVVVDRPFFFAIVDDDTGAVLFSGLVYEPVDPGEPDIGVQGRPAGLSPADKLLTNWGEVKTAN